MMKVLKTEGRFTIEMDERDFDIFRGIMATLVVEAGRLDWDHAADDDVTLESVEKFIDSWIGWSSEQAAGR